jgi:hypothetical protein
MNSYKSKFILLLTFGMGMSLFSCKDYLDVNVDPNRSTISRTDLQLSASQLHTSIGMGQRLFPNLAIWCQYYTGGPGVALGDPDQHKLASSEGNEIFRSMYRSASNLDFILNNSTEPSYLAIAKIMRAYNFQVCVDLFGDIPYTEALNGDIADGSVLHPKYDNAATVVYPGIEAELLDAIKLIEEEAPVHPTTDDLIYGGDMAKWNKFAHTLLLKIYLRQGASGQAKAQAAGFYTSDDQFIIANEDNAAIAFPGGATGSNPFWTATKSTSLGNFYVATTTALDYLTATSDPRLSKFFDPKGDGNQVGLYPGSIETISPGETFSTPEGAKLAAGGFIFSPTAPVILMSSWEGNLLLAEAGARGWLSTDVAATYANAVHASFEYLGFTADSDTTYLATGGKLDETSEATKLKSIALQKWTCMNGLQPIESWIETRRFDTPSASIFTGPGGLFKSPTQNALGAGIFPSILPYPENEESLNQSFPGQHPITAKVFWDN